LKFFTPIVFDGPKGFLLQSHQPRRRIGCCPRAIVAGAVIAGTVIYASFQIESACQNEL
jgi:hypothetical protein